MIDSRHLGKGCGSNHGIDQIMDMDELKEPLGSFGHEKDPLHSQLKQQKKVTVARPVHHRRTQDHDLGLLHQQAAGSFSGQFAASVGRGGSSTHTGWPSRAGPTAARELR